MLLNCYCIVLQFADIDISDIKSSYGRIILLVFQCGCCNYNQCGCCQNNKFDDNIIEHKSTTSTTFSIKSIIFSTNSKSAAPSPVSLPDDNHLEIKDTMRSIQEEMEMEMEQIDGMKGNIANSTVLKITPVNSLVESKINE